MERSFLFAEAPFRHCHAATVASTPEGLVAAWFAGTHEQHPDVEIWVSRREAGRWTAPAPVATGAGRERHPTWNPVLLQIPGGELLLFYKVGPAPSSWWGMVKRSRDHGRSWSEARRLPDGIVGPTRSRPLLLGDGRMVSPSSTEGERWAIHFELSDDLGESWEKVGPVEASEGRCVIQPALLRHGPSVLQALARSRENRIMNSWSYDAGRTWSRVEPLPLPNPNSGIDAVTLTSGRHLLVYNHSASAAGAWGGPRMPLSVAVSGDGTSWERVLDVEDAAGARSYRRYDDVVRAEDEPVECSYPSVIESEDGMVHLLYTWNRCRIRHVVLDPDQLAEA